MSRLLAAVPPALFAVSLLSLALAQAPESEPFGPNLPGAPPPPPPPPANAPAPSGSAGVPPEAASGTAPAPTPSGAPAPAASAGPDEPDGGAAPAAPSPSAPPEEGSSGAPSEYAPVYPTIPPTPGDDEGAERRKKASEKTVLVSRIEAAGTLAQGLDATDAPLRQGGFRLGGAYRIAEDFVLAGGYAFASGHVRERLPGNAAGGFGVPNDVDVLESRHAFEVTFGYVLHSEGPIRFFGVPFLGPRVPVLVNDVAPRWAFEAEFGGRAGVAASDGFEATVLLAYAPALAKAKDLADVQGPILGELRFGAGTAWRAGGPFFLTLGYEGNVLLLSHEKLTAHGLNAGLTYALE